MSTKLETLTSELGITMAVKPGAPFNEDFDNSDGWTVTLRYKGKRFSTAFYMGKGHYGREPSAADVLACLCSDADAADSSRNFEDFASEFGYSLDSRKAERTYKACLRNGKRLHALLGEDFDRIAEAAREY